MAQPSGILLSADGYGLPDTVRAWLRERAIEMVGARSAQDVLRMALRGRPRIVIFDGRVDVTQALDGCRDLKRDSFTGVVPALLLCGEEDDAVSEAFAAGADEVLRPRMTGGEIVARLDALLRRAERDLHVHPSTRLPGSPEIEQEITRRIASGAPFSVCYADLDHFKEYNDRYSYSEGDRVIRVFARILHDVAKGVSGAGGFVGHIGGDDFIFIVPTALSGEICQEIVTVFDLLVPYQYSEQDRRAGYYFGKDRRGQLHRVPLMTVSIGIVTNERRVLMHPGQVGELAAEMKTYAKTLPGSVWVVDRRYDPAPDEPTAERRDLAARALTESA
ncbi:MAG: diguanylate cyclase [Gemmatimonadaceae bacterium]